MNSGPQFSSCQTVSQTCYMVEGYWILLRHWPWRYFLLASMKHFPFKMGFCGFPCLCVFRSPIEEAGTQSEIQSTQHWHPHLSWSVAQCGAFEHTAPGGALLFAKYFWKRLYRLWSTAGCPPPLHWQLSLWNGKCVDLLSTSIQPLLLTFSKLPYKMIPLK